MIETTAKMKERHLIMIEYTDLTLDLYEVPKVYTFSHQFTYSLLL